MGTAFVKVLSTQVTTSVSVQPLKACPSIDSRLVASSPCLVLTVHLQTGRRAMVKKAAAQSPPSCWRVLDRRWSDQPFRQVRCDSSGFRRANFLCKKQHGEPVVGNHCRVRIPPDGAATSCNDVQRGTCAVHYRHTTWLAPAENSS
jgi:hypothetical protein